MPLASVVIPAHNEAATIGRSLGALHRGAGDVELDVVVVCNGCSDDTAEVARRADPGARVIEIAEPSKAEAVRVGNAATRVFPRVHLDADVELDGASLVALVGPLRDGRAMATAPRRSLSRDGCSVWVRWYYDVWEALPQVEAGLFGRGVVALTEAAQARVAALAPMMSDDLAMSEAFTSAERLVVVGAVAVVHVPRTVRDLVRRRTRVVTGNVQADRAGVRRRGSRTRLRILAALAVARPGLALRLPVFAAVSLLATLRARRAIRAGDFTTWQRDESSRVSAGA
jgi:glycosyltransferase involved in cell wall biosynthesis